MNPEALKALGLNDEQVKGAMALYGKDLNPLKEQVTSLTTERDAAKAQVTTVTGQLDQLQKDHKSDSELKAEIDKLKEANTQAEKDAAAQLNQVKLDSATNLALLQSGALNAKAVTALLNKDALKLDDKGNLTGLDDQLKALKEADDSKFLFKAADPADKKPNSPQITTQGNPNADPANGTSMVDKIAARLAGKTI
ncbi:phage scaffolding protein [Lacticaseibacillus daqingensis]|uniref:phage scaffolding protein n=1 Tax=Lacticaseibacillus daqingensis TaxID=2486014 RepID=UPI000F7B45C9|nr:phage scaffolding protein [Lacticaseibacillus daqingensis]